MVDIYLDKEYGVWELLDTTGAYHWKLLSHIPASPDISVARGGHYDDATVQAFGPLTSVDTKTTYDFGERYEKGDSVKIDGGWLDRNAGRIEVMGRDPIGIVTQTAGPSGDIPIAITFNVPARWVFKL